MKAVCTVSCLLMVLSGFSHAAVPDPSQQNFPFIMTFKACAGVGMDDPVYSAILAAHKDFDWIHAPDFLWTDLKASPKLTNICKTYPDKILTLQDAWGGAMNRNGYRMKHAWQGYWLYRPGTTVISALSKDTVEITVENPKRILSAPDRLESLSRQMPYTIVLYRRGSDGVPDFDHAEQAVVTAIKGNRLTLQRGAWGTVPQAFPVGEAFAAPHVYFWGSQWQMNLSLHCPRGGPGNQTAAEWLADVVAKGVNLTGADGVEFDVARWTFGNPNLAPADCDNDGEVDYGWIDGINSFGLGGQVFLKRLRELLPNKLIQMDSNDALYGQRGWQYVNGIQIECFPGMNEFDRFSEEFLHLRQWCANVTERPAISYPFTKCATTTYSGAKDKEGNSLDYRFRIGLAAACLTGMPHPFLNLLVEGFQADEDNSIFASGKGDVIPGSGEVERAGVYRWDEYFGGDLNRSGWLGKPLAAAVQSDSDLNLKTDVAGWSKWVVQNEFSADTEIHGDLFRTDVEQIPPQTVPADLFFGCSLKTELNAPLRIGEEYTVVFEARGADSWTVKGTTYTKVPRAVTLRGVAEENAKDPVALLVDSEWREYRITMTAGKNSSQTLEFGCSEQTGCTQFRNIHLYPGSAERWIREFEHGVVLLNASQHPWTVDLPSRHYVRLRGAQNPDVNNGEPVGEAVTVPAYDALFLRTNEPQ